MFEVSFDSRVGPKPPSSFDGLRFRLTPSSRGRDEVAEDAAEAEDGVGVDNLSRAP